MVYILDGNSVMGAHARSILCYWICSKQLIRSQAVRNRIFFLRKDPLPFMRAQHVTIQYKYHGHYRHKSKKSYAKVKVKAGVHFFYQAHFQREKSDFFFRRMFEFFTSYLRPCFNLQFNLIIEFKNTLFATFF